ncbi:hypothetical protein L484_018871 [Morus notabilis]|uniref:Uncharacterized protein n=1 Tax=Morus notabilis TaxID=981085 RepID=W9QS92_9ROSA|nr:hypothetical protein L484_018871 [Morus notabilis]
MEEDHRERKKRKMDAAKEEEENMRRNEEEENMEEFFALIRSTREVRDRLRSCGFKDQKKEEKINKDVDIVAKEIGAWNPTFRPEDFLDDHEKKISCTDLPLHDSVLGSTSQLTDHVGASKIEVEEEEENVKEDNKGGKDSNNLDLELSL